MKALPVVTEQGEVVGLVADEDLLSRAGLQQRLSVAKRLDANLVREELVALRSSPFKVKGVMNQPAITAKATESLGAAAARMARHGIKRLPIVDETGKLMGVLSRVDILHQVVEAEPKARKA